MTELASAAMKIDKAAANDRVMADYAASAAARKARSRRFQAFAQAALASVAR